MANGYEGTYSELSNEDYHADPAISRSGIMMFRESPYKFWANYLNPHRPPKESTKAMEFGTAFHTFILEPDLFKKEYIIQIELEKLPKVGLLRDLGRPEYERQKAERAKIEVLNEKISEEFLSIAADKTILSPSEWYVIQEMYNALINYHEALQLIVGAKYEQSYFWQDQESGLWLKARPDILHDNMIVDLKTCVSASTRAYQRVMTDSGYHIQGAMIREAVNVLESRDIPNVINICCEKLYPWEIGIKIIDEEALESGRIEFKKTLMQMKECFETNVWPSHVIETVGLHRWSL